MDSSRTELTVDAQLVNDNGEERMERKRRMVGGARDCSYSACVFASVEHFNNGSPMICYIPEGRSFYMRMSPPAEIAGDELILAAYEDLRIRFPELVPVV
ncbi:hypothetical protein IT774_05195 [Salinimonas marina]|uniref:Uncharacterized protein n=1 Tax=Salinimonas marina TaxID=2785918 RepID=A0A7S9DZ52_9ALTE|nr:hypothetical protein [Salinimonas marina]QPG06570.1 hypothetical protein IT774_05195 [Salinimonas marina]